MSMYEIFSRRPEWESAIGRLMMASAHLEANVLIVIANYGGYDLAKKVSRSGHDHRLTVLEKFASGRDEKTRSSVNKIVEALREFNRQRNHIAHNPLGFALDENSTENHRYGAIMNMVSPGHKIGLDEVVALAEEGESLSKGFTFKWMVLMGVPK